MTTPQEIKDVAIAHCISMFGYRNQALSEEQLADFENPGIIAELDYCRKWLRDQPRRKTLNRSTTSYGLKHRVEQAMKEAGDRSGGRINYVSNGCFMIAAVLEGFTLRREEYGSPNGFINIAKLSNNQRHF